MSALEFPGRVAIIGAGTMGAGIAIRYALAGADAALTSRREATLAAARERVTASLEMLVAQGAVDADDRDVAQKRISYSSDLDTAASGADLVIESIAEDPERKRAVLVRAEAAAAPGALITSNTSSLSLADISSALARPERFAGYHWFNPPELLELVEIVCVPATSEETAGSLLHWAARVGSCPVLVRREVPGFIANRLQYALMREAWALVEAGVCGYEDIDAVMTTGLGARWAAVGPAEAMDLAGLDVHLTVARELYPKLTRTTEPPSALAEHVARGALGCKTGNGLRGHYDADDERRLAERRARIMLALPGLRGSPPPRSTS
jgi:3-hydroxybutyryl-CoA dehydrogenase